jgi:Tfp pilus assembly protein PilF
VLTRLGYLYQASGDEEAAEQYYQQVLKRDPGRAVVAANRGVFYARRGMMRQALDLWRAAFDKNPHLSEIGVNLGRGLCGVGDAEGARAALQRVLTHNPDLALAREALADVAQTGCIAKVGRTFRSARREHAHGGPSVLDRAAVTSRAPDETEICAEVRRTFSLQIWNP